MLLILASVAAHALAPSCTVSWEDLRAGGRAVPGGAAVLGSDVLGVVDDGETVRPLIGLPVACALGHDGPRGQIGGDKLVVLDRAAPALARYEYLGGGWAEVDRFTGPFPHAGEADFATVFRADVDRVAIRSEEEVALPARPRSFVDVLHYDGTTWVPDGALEWPRVGSAFETDHWLHGDFLRFPAIDYGVWVQEGGVWTFTVPSTPAGYDDPYLGPTTAFDGITLVGTLKDAFTTRLTVHTWTGAGWIEDAVLTSPPVHESDGYTSAVAVSGDLIAATWNSTGGDEDTGSTPGSQPPSEIHIWKRHDAAWALVDSFVSTRRGDALGSTLDLHGTVLLVGSLAEGEPVNPAAADPYGAVYVFDLLPLLDSESPVLDGCNGIDDDVDGLVDEDCVEVDTGTDVEPLPDPDTGAPATDGKPAAGPVGCACDSSVGGAGMGTLWLTGLLLSARARRRGAGVEELEPG